MDSLVIQEYPELKEPYLVLAFDGWPNAGGVAVQAALYLRRKLGASRFASIAAEEFYVFSVLRPFAAIEAGEVKGVRFPSNEFFAWKSPGPGHDLILFLGTEPHLRWQTYLDCLFHIIREFGVARTLSLGATYDQVPHTLEPRISSSTNQPRLLEELRGLNIALTDYMGPCSFHTMMLDACKKLNLESLSLWGHVPHYVQGVGNPKVAHALLQRLTRLLGLSLDLTDIKQAGDQLDEMLSRFMAQKPELREYVRTLEEELRGTAGALPLEGGDRIVREVEEFLRQEQRRRGGGGPPDS